MEVGLSDRVRLDRPTQVGAYQTRIDGAGSRWVNLPRRFRSQRLRVFGTQRQLVKNGGTSRVSGPGNVDQYALRMLCNDVAPRSLSARRPLLGSDVAV